MKIETLQSLIARTRNEINILHEEEQDLKKVIRIHTKSIGGFTLLSSWTKQESRQHLVTLRKDLAKVKSRIKKLVAIQRELKRELNEAILSNKTYKNVAEFCSFVLRFGDIGDDR